MTATLQTAAVAYEPDTVRIARVLLTDEDVPTDPASDVLAAVCSAVAEYDFSDESFQRRNAAEALGIATQWNAGDVQTSLRAIDHGLLEALGLVAKLLTSQLAFDNYNLYNAILHATLAEIAELLREWDELTTMGVQQ